MRVVSPANLGRAQFRGRVPVYACVCVCVCMCACTKMFRCPVKLRLAWS